MSAKSLQLCPTLCNPMDCRLPGSCVHGILQEKTLEWVAMPLFRKEGRFSSLKVPHPKEMVESFAGFHGLPNGHHDSW